MGRRKIEIKAIKDDRNRSVTFLKRKGGLFKKAHELSVLCSVDVAVIIFGNNKKLYEYSSSDIGEIIQRHNFYGGANEHKGPADFNGKKDLGSDEDDEDDDNNSQEPPLLPYNSHPQYQHMRHAPSASPPIPNGAQFAHIQRQHTPQPPTQMSSRPASRNAIQRVNSNLAQQHMHQTPQPSPPMNGFQYMQQPGLQQPSMYHPGAGQMPPHTQPQQQPTFQYSGPPQQQMPQPQQHPNMQQVFLQDQRRSSMPPQFPQQERQGSMHNTPQPPPMQLPSQQAPQPQPHVQMPQQQMQQPRQPLPPQQQAASAQMLEPVKRMSVKSRSIFTPIDESRSILSQHWASSTSQAENIKPDPTTVRSTQDQTNNQNKQVGPGAANEKGKMTSPPIPAPRTNPILPKRNASLSSLPSSQGTFTPPPRMPPRTNSMQAGAGGAKRPRLKVQIPDEPSDGGSTGTGSAIGQSPRHTSEPGTSTTVPNKGVVLPPPSPSASALLSAGASGPPNPFARPLPPSQNPSHQSNQSLNHQNTHQSSNISGRDSIGADTPVSALPSRFIGGEFLPSPSSFYPEWNFRSLGELGSPLTMSFATPIVGSGPSFLRDDPPNSSGPGVNGSGRPELKSENSNGGGAGNGTGPAASTTAKRKSPGIEEGGEGAGEAKKVKIEG